jgi:hypothetical protein
MLLPCSNRRARNCVNFGGENAALSQRALAEVDRIDPVGSVGVIDAFDEDEWDEINVG